MKKSIIIVALSFLVSGIASAQFRPVFPTSSSNQKIVETAIEDAICFVRIEFQLEDTVSRERFNLEGKSYFGFAEGLCVKTEKGWIAPAGVVTPWKNSQEVKQFPDYKPALSTVSAISVADTVWKPFSMYSVDKVEDVPGTSYSCVLGTAPFGPGLVCSGLDGKTEGWIVWVSRKGDKLSVTTYSHSVNPADSVTFGIGRKVVPEGVVGGFYVKPVYPSVGVIRFELAGVMDKGQDGWKVDPLAIEPKAGKPSSTPSTRPSIAPDKPKIVPATGDKAEEKEAAPAKNKKNKKNKK